MSASARRRRSLAAIAVALAAAAAGRSVAQAPATGPAAPVTTAPVTTAPVTIAPDTARIAFVAAAAAPAPAALHVLADTVAFGGALPVAWDLAPGSEPGVPLPTPDGSQLVALEPSPRPWWRPWGGGMPAAPAGRWAALPPAGGERVVAWYRVYHAGPFRLDWSGRASQVVVVRGRVDDPARVAAIRDPRPVPWLTPAALGLLALATAVAALAWWWRRRGRADGHGDWPLPEPAWLATALSLRELLAEGHLERGQARVFLDRLAGEARRFAAAQYRVPAADLTGGELAAACAARGHAPAGPRALARLLDAADLHRYDPAEPGPAFCREQLAEFLACVAAGRIQPRYVPVSAERRLAAEQAWSEVSRSGAARSVTAGTGGVA